MEGHGNLWSSPDFVVIGQTCSRMEFQEKHT